MKYFYYPESTAFGRQPYLVRVPGGHNRRGGSVQIIIFGSEGPTEWMPDWLVKRLPSLDGKEISEEEAAMILMETQ